MGAIENFQKSLNLPLGDMLQQNWIFVLVALVVLAALIFNLVGDRDGVGIGVSFGDDGDGGDGGGGDGGGGGD
jgi:hypothetical protein